MQTHSLQQKILSPSWMVLELAISFLAIVFSATVHAQDVTSTWNAGSSNWNTSGNWLPASVPSSSQNTILLFNSSASSYTSTNNIAGAFTLNSLQFAGTAGGAIAIAPSGSSLSFQTDSLSNTPTIKQSSTSAVTISSNIAVNNALTLQGSGSGTVTLSGVISGSNGVTVNSTGAYIFTGTNSSFSGGVTLSGGILEGSNSASFGTGTLNLNGGQLSSNSTSSRSFSNVTKVGSNATVTIGSSNASTNGALTFGGALTLGNSSVLNVASSVSFNAPVTIGGGGTTGSATIAVASGATLSIFSGAPIGNGDSGSDSLIVGSGGSSGTVSIGAANTFSGGLTLNSGTLLASSNAAFGTGTLTLNGGRLSAGSTSSKSFTNAVSIGANKNITVGNTGGTLNGALTFSGSTTFGNNSKLSADSTATFSGTIAVGNDITLAPSTDVTLTLKSLEVSKGVTLDFDLASIKPLVITNALTDTGSVANAFKFDFTNASVGIVYTIATFGSSNLTASDLQVNGGFTVSRWIINSGNLQVEFSAVPEPSAGILLGAGVLALVVTGRFRRKRIRG